MGSDAPETVAAIVAAHRAATMTPAQTIARSYQRIRDHNDPAVFISLRDEKDALAEAEALAARTRRASAVRRAGRGEGQYRRAGLPTTAACPAFAYSPAHGFDGGRKTARGRRHHHRQDQSRPVRDRLVGVRSPYGIPVNPIRADLIPAGRVRDQAVAFPPAWCQLALGTDPRVSGAVPRCSTTSSGLKPSLGLISNAGLVPACRTLDCISVFSAHRRRRDDPRSAAMAGPDGADPFSARPVRSGALVRVSRKNSGSACLATAN
jgi:allophanate hydrolase